MKSKEHTVKNKPRILLLIVVPLIALITVSMTLENVPQPVEDGKTLVIIRHAKSSREHRDLRDFYRPLNDRGYKDAPFMGQVLKRKGIQPDLVVASPSVRTYTTATMICDKLDYSRDDIQFAPSIYRAPKEKYIEEIASWDDKYNTVFLVGHNPASSQLSTMLSDTTISDMPTTGIVAIHFDENSWAKIAKSKGECVFFDKPKNHKERQ